MNQNYPNIVRIPPASFLILCCLVMSYFSYSAGKANAVYRKSISCIGQERDALLNFKQHTYSNDECGLMDSWGNPNTPDCCTWKGVSCNNQSGHVIGLHLSGTPYNRYCLRIRGLSPSLGQLKHLEYLDLSSNVFNNDITDIVSSVGSFVNLVNLNLSGSDLLYGNIPNQLGNFTSLTSLDLSNISGLAAKSLNWLSRLTLLRDINLGGIDLSNAKDWFRIIGSLPLLEVIEMDYCQLSMPLSSSSSSSSILHSANLRVISLSGNGFSSSSSFQWLNNIISNYLSVQQSLEHFDLSNNFLQGRIPDAIGNLKSLTYLDLSQNLLSSTIPDAIGNLKSLTYLDLSKNNGLTKITLNPIANLKSLRHMDLSCNLLSGTIPDAFGNLEFLTHLDLSQNSLSSTIPDAIGNLKFLTYLDLSKNSLSSTIPDAISNLLSLTHMDLSWNSLSGSIPGSLGGASSLSHLDLSYNQLEGTIPASIANLKYLGYLDLSRNNLSGDIPCKLELRELPYYASFSFNNLSGSIPKRLSYLGLDTFEGNPSFRADKIQGSCDKDDKDKINIGLYVSIGLGFYTGFWAFCGTLTVKNSWRQAYFRFLDNMIDKVYVFVLVYFARFRRNFQG